jgi:hypothetical protein
VANPEILVRSRSGETLTVSILSLASQFLIVHTILKARMARSTCCGIDVDRHINSRKFRFHLTADRESWANDIRRTIMQVERYVPQLAFPPYAFVPGVHPHPVTDIRGHQFGYPHGAPAPLDPARPCASLDFLFGVDLFNSGYYWEAHEAWEGLWMAAGRTGPVADFLKGLIKLAAAGVKARTGQSVGVQRHARRADELFQSVQDVMPTGKSAFCGIRIAELIRAARSLVAEPIVDTTPSIVGRGVFSYSLVMDDLDPLSIPAYTSQI